MDLRQVAAVRSEFLPYVRNGIQTNNVDPLIAEVEHILGHVAEHSGIGVVEVPLVGIKGRHDNLSRIPAPGKITRRGRREDLGNVFFELLRDRPVVEKEIPVLILFFSGAGTASPLMILAGVVHHEVETQRDPVFVAVVCKRGKSFHRAQFRLYLTKIRYRIAAVTSPFRAFEQRHKMQVVHAAVADVVQLCANSVKITGKG